jgi:hypothetical protein
VQAETGNSWMLSDEEKRQLMGELDEIAGSNQEINAKVVDLTSKQNSIESELNDIQDGLV